MLYHLSRTSQYLYDLNLSLPVAADYQPAKEKMVYAQLGSRAQEAVASLVRQANGNNQDLTKHPWALLGVYEATLTTKSFAVILQWQPAEAIPPPIVQTTLHIPELSSSRAPAPQDVDGNLLETMSIA